MNVHLTQADLEAYQKVVSTAESLGVPPEDVLKIEDFSDVLASVILDRLAALDEPVFSNPTTGKAASSVHAVLEGLDYSMATNTTTHNMDSPGQIEAIAEVFHLIIGYRKRGTGLEPLLLLEIAREEGCTSRHLQEKLGVDQSTISRETRALGAGKVGRGRRRKCKLRDGKGLIYCYKEPLRLTEVTPEARAQKTYRLRYALTDQGREILGRAQDHLSRYFPSCPLKHCHQRHGLRAAIEGSVTTHADHDR